MIGTRGAAANVETKHVKKDIHERWKVRMWGFANEKIFMVLALCSESTGRSKLNCFVLLLFSGNGVVEVSTEKEDCCFPVEFSGEPTNLSAIARIDIRLSSNLSIRSLGPPAIYTER